ncbi:MAG: TraB/GumN family protein [Sphingomonadales bacterium]|nr:TraB/GumN family protein [Sphingomonadaceae bacterium]MBS3931351.1 TraB/GumN family protein [Sphingomonadales bacterium]
MTFRRILFAFAASAAALLAPSAFAEQAPVPAPVAVPTDARPALWKVADHDTTIYLFGTIHVLPQGIDWYKGPIRQAFEHSDLLMTELPDLSTGEVAAAMLKQGMLPKGQTLRGLMNDEQRGRYDAALTKIGVQPAMFDHNRPWVVALLLPLVRVQQLGFDPQHGVESQLDKRAKELKRPRQGLETIDQQFAIFAGLSEAGQMEYLMAVVDALPEIDGQINTMVGHWAKGDAAALAKFLQADGDKVLGEALIHNRNRIWAGWIAERMKQPGTVFIAVGTGHLGGKDSVQDVLAKGGYKAARVQ